MKRVTFDLDDEFFNVLISQSKFDASRELGIAPSTIEKFKYIINNGEIGDIEDATNVVDDDVDEDTLDAYITREQKSKQRMQDNLRITRKQIREKNRHDSIIAARVDALTTILEQRPPHTWKHDLGESLNATGGVGVIQLSDHHINEIVELANNTYDFKVASKRLQYLAKRAKKRFTDEGVSKVLVVASGDLMNSDRRMDEMLTMATNRMKAQMLAVMLYEQFIYDIAEEFHVEVASVIGNESRVGDKHSHLEVLASNNYDWSINSILKMLFRDCERVEFIDFDNPVEGIINVNGYNLLIIHGDTIGQNSIHTTISKIKSKIAAKTGIVIDYVIFGHIHSAYCSESFSRSGSLVGANAYSDGALNLESRASQNIYIFNDNYIEPTMIDLQNTVGVDGYYIDSALEAYNAKSAKKAQKYKIHNSK